MTLGKTSRHSKEGSYSATAVSLMLRGSGEFFVRKVK